MPTSVGSTVQRLAIDILSGWLFLAVYLTTGNIYLATALGAATGAAQLAWMIAHRRSIDPMQWLALGLVIVLGSATMLTRDPRFVVFKPSIVEGCLGVWMLRPGWMLRYVPSRARELVPGLLVFWCYLWAVAWLALAASNPVIAHVYGLKAWAVYTNFSPLVLQGVGMALGMLVFPPLTRRAARARGIAVASATPSA